MCPSERVWFLIIWLSHFLFSTLSLCKRVPLDSRCSAADDLSFRLTLESTRLSFSLCHQPMWHEHGFTRNDWGFWEFFGAVGTWGASLWGNIKALELSFSLFLVPWTLSCGRRGKGRSLKRLKTEEGRSWINPQSRSEVRKEKIQGLWGWFCGCPPPLQPGGQGEVVKFSDAGWGSPLGVTPDYRWDLKEKICCVFKCVDDDGGAGGSSCPPSWSCPRLRSQMLRSHTHFPRERFGSNRPLPSSFPRSWQRSGKTQRKYRWGLFCDNM